MNKVFVVPPAEKLGIGRFFVAGKPNCAVGHLGSHVGLDSSYTGLFCPQAAKILGCAPDAMTELMRLNDMADQGEPRREVFISWLRTHFPNQEVKS